MIILVYYLNHPICKINQNKSIFKTVWNFQQQRKRFFFTFSESIFTTSVSPDLAVVYYYFWPTLSGFSVSWPPCDSYSSLFLNFFCFCNWFSLIISTTLKNRAYIPSPDFAEILWKGSLCFSIIDSNFFLSI